MSNQSPPPPSTPPREVPAYTHPPFPQAPYPAYGYQGAPPSKTMATWALVLGVIPIPLGNLVAIGLGINVLVRSRDGHDHGKGMAIAALVIAPLWLLLFAALIVAGVAGQAERAPTGGVTQRGDVPVTSLEVGDCLPEGVATDRANLTVAVAPCSAPHTDEVFADFDLAPGPYPRESELFRLAEGGCAKRFAGFVGKGYGKSELEIAYLYPMRSSWSRDRGVTCLVESGSPSTGTLEGSRR